MKSFRHSFRLLLSQRTPLFRQLWLPYTFFALTVALFIVGAVHLLTRWVLPYGLLKSEGAPSEVMTQVLGLDLVGLGLGFVGLLSSLIAALWAHRASLRAVAPYVRAQGVSMSSERRIMRISLAGSLVALWLLLWALPLLTLSLGIGTLTLAQLQDDLVVLPSSLWWALGAVAAAGMWVLQGLALYIRLVLTHRAF